MFVKVYFLGAFFWRIVDIILDSHFGEIFDRGVLKLRFRGRVFGEGFGMLFGVLLGDVLERVLGGVFERV